jgi:hypothetical protein
MDVRDKLAPTMCVARAGTRQSLERREMHAFQWLAGSISKLGTYEFLRFSIPIFPDTLFHSFLIFCNVLFE